MIIPIEDISSGNIYKTNDPDFPYVYVLLVEYIEEHKYENKTLVKHKKGNEIVARFLCRVKDNSFDPRYKGNYDYYGNSYEDLGDKRFTELVDFKPIYSKEFGHHVEIDFRNVWRLDHMCAGISEPNKHFCDNKPYKFNKDLVLRSFDYQDVTPHEFEKNIKNSFKEDKYIKFEDYANSVPAIERHDIYYFKDKAHYDLARLMFIKK